MLLGLAFSFIFLFLCEGIIRLFQRRCPIHHQPIQNQELDWTKRTIESDLVKKAFAAEYRLARQADFPHTIRWPTCHFSPGLNPTEARYCSECLGEEEKWVKETSALETQKVAVLNAKGWTTCPWCHFRFQPDPQEPLPSRHTRCGHKIHIQSDSPDTI